MADKASVQACMTTAEAALTTQQKQLDPRKTNGDDSAGYASATLATAMAALRTEIDALA